MQQLWKLLNYLKATNLWLLKKGGTLNINLNAQRHPAILDAEHMNKSNPVNLLESRAKSNVLTYSREDLFLWEKAGIPIPMQACNSIFLKMGGTFIPNHFMGPCA